MLQKLSKFSTLSFRECAYARAVVVFVVSTHSNYVERTTGVLCLRTQSKCVALTLFQLRQRLPLLSVTGMRGCQPIQRILFQQGVQCVSACRLRYRRVLSQGCDHRCRKLLLLQNIGIAHRGRPVPQKAAMLQWAFGDLAAESCHCCRKLPGPHKVAIAAESGHCFIEFPLLQRVAFVAESGHRCRVAAYRLMVLMLWPAMLSQL